MSRAESVHFYANECSRLHSHHLVVVVAAAAAVVLRRSDDDSVDRISILILLSVLVRPCGFQGSGLSGYG